MFLSTGSFPLCSLHFGLLWHLGGLGAGGGALFVPGDASTSWASGGPWGCVHPALLHAAQSFGLRPPLILRLFAQASPCCPVDYGSVLSCFFIPLHWMCPALHLLSHDGAWPILQVPLPCCFGAGFIAGWWSLSGVPLYPLGVPYHDRSGPWGSRLLLFCLAVPAVCWCPALRSGPISWSCGLCSSVPRLLSLRASPAKSCVCS